MTLDHPYRPRRLRATFEDWYTKDRLRQIRGTFEIEMRQIEAGRRTVCQAMTANTLQHFGKPFAQSKLDECKTLATASKD